jgi:DNA-binding response OmpR family regulator
MMRPRALARPLSVLIVDTFPDTAASLALVLNLEGFTARAALSADEALAAVAAEAPDVLVIEPRTLGGGWDLVRRLAEPVDGCRPALVALTTDTSAAGRAAADLVGVGVYLVKPETPRVVVDLLRGFGREREPAVTVTNAAAPLDGRAAAGAGRPSAPA